jgi:hypothetical protein
MLRIGAGVGEVQRVLFGLLDWTSVATLVLFGCDGDRLRLALRRVPLTIVQSPTAAQFVGVIIAASVVLGAQMRPRAGSAALVSAFASSWSVSMQTCKKNDLTPPLFAPLKRH